MDEIYALLEKLGISLPRRSQLGLMESVHIVLRDADGNVKHEETVHNAVTANGKGLLAEQILAAPAASTKPTQCSVGTSSGTQTDTALGAEVASSKTAFTSKTRSGAVVTMVTDFAAGVGTGALNEAGIWDSEGTPVLVLRTSFSVINKGASDTLSVTWTLTYS